VPQTWNESNRAHSDFGNFLLELYLDKIKQQIKSHVNTCTIKLPLMFSRCIRWMLIFPQFLKWWIWLHHWLLNWLKQFSWRILSRVSFYWCYRSLFSIYLAVLPYLLPIVTLCSSSNRSSFIYKCQTTAKYLLKAKFK